MAKGKRAVALFEVIQKDKRFARKEESPAPMPPPQTVSIAPGFSAARIKELLRDKKAALGVRDWADSFAKIPAAWRAGAARLTAWARIAQSWAARQNSVVMGAVVALLVIGAVLLARHRIHPVTDTASRTTLVQGPAHPSVLAIPTSNAQAQVETSGLSPEMAADIVQAAPQAAVSMAQPGGRIVNMHYILIQSYLDEKTADAALQFLNANGIACTIEHGVKGWRKDFYQIIGLEGFPRAGGPAYLAYRRKIDNLSILFTQGHLHSYKHFEPEAIRW
jgi:hypothetical protein